MGYRTGVITDADPAARMIEQIEAEMTAQGTWEFVEQVTVSAIIYRVWRCRGTGNNANVFGQPFHVALYRSSATAFSVKVFEHWRTDTKRLIRPTRGNSTASAPNATTFAFGDETNGFTLDTAAGATGNGFSGLVTTGLDYFIQVSRNRVWVGIKQGTSDAAISFGIFETLMVAGDPFPLYSLNTGSLNGSEFSMTDMVGWSRHPNVTTSLSSNFCARAWTAHGPMVGGVNSTNADRLQGVGAILISRCRVETLGVLQSQHLASAVGWIRGLLYDTIRLQEVGSSRSGDTITIGGQVYVLFFNGSTRYWVLRDAA